MKVGIFADTHDRFDHMRTAIRDLKKNRVKHVLFLGDFVAPSLAQELFSAGFKVKAVFGNCDGDKQTIMKFATKDKVEMSTREFAEFDIDKMKVFATHYPHLADIAAESGRYDAIFHGHSHEIREKILGNGCLIACPGELAGFKTGKVSFMIWDTDLNTVELVELN